MSNAMKKRAVALAVAAVDMAQLETRQAQGLALLFQSFAENEIRIALRHRQQPQPAKEPQ